MSNGDGAVVGVAMLWPLPGRESEVEQACRAAVRSTHGEPGCQRFALHRVSDGGGGFAIIERWDSAGSLHEHTERPAFARLGEVLKEALASPPSFTLLEPLPDGDGQLGSI